MNLKINKIKKSSKRVGRGPSSNKGKTCGRGMNGQRSRSGASTTYRTGGQTKLYMQLPKNSSLKAKKGKLCVTLSSDYIINNFSKDEKIGLAQIKSKLSENRIKCVKIIKGKAKLEARKIDKNIKCSKNLKSIFQNA